MPSSPNPTPRPIHLLQLAFGAVLVSFSPVLVKTAEIGPFAAGFWRMLFGGIFLLIIVVIRRQRMWAGWLPLGLAVLCGVFFSADLSFWHQSIFFVGPGLATILANFQVFFVTAIAIIFLGEKAGWRLFVAIPLAIVGLLLLFGLDWMKLPGDYRLGVVFGLITALCYTGYLLTLRRSRTNAIKLPNVSNIAIVSIVATVLLGSEALLAGENLQLVRWESWGSMLAYGIFCQGVGWVIMSRALPHVPASRIGLILLLQPTLSLCWDIIFFGKPMSWMESIGAAITLVAIYFGSTSRKEEPV
jgi:drug/metabolite transporter (DMT)-like permease